ncbi:MAG: TM2 domain-containing protein [Cytophagales bacterium]|nr:TM2 domain-containing protein [Cytophagales bacterium]
MPRKSSALVVCLLLGFVAFSQTNFQEDFRFLKHLEGLEEWQEGLLLLTQLEPQAISSGRADTLNFFKGKFTYKSKQPEASVEAFRLVNESNLEYYRYARFFGAFQSAYTGNVSSATDFLNAYQPEDSLSIRIKNLQLAGLNLMNRDYTSYLDRQSQFTLNYELEPYEQGMMERYNDLQAYKKKSPFVAGLMSAIVPGAGRFYMGKPGQGIAAFFVTGVFGLQAWEGYRKDGPDSARFIIFGSLFTISHVANIWGSALGVRIRREEFNDQMNASILLDMHIPLRVLVD